MKLHHHLLVAAAAVALSAPAFATTNVYGDLSFDDAVVEGFIENTETWERFANFRDIAGLDHDTIAAAIAPNDGTIPYTFGTRANAYSFFNAVSAFDDIINLTFVTNQVHAVELGASWVDGLFGDSWDATQDVVYFQSDVNNRVGTLSFSASGTMQLDEDVMSYEDAVVASATNVMLGGNGAAWLLRSTAEQVSGS